MTNSIASRYHPTNARSSRRTLAYPNTSRAVPRTPFILLSSRMGPLNQGPSLSFFCIPMVRNIGGCRL